MKKGQMVKVVDKDFGEHLVLMEQLFGSGNTPDLQGELLAINPTAEEFATFDDNFKQAVAFGEVVTENLKDTAVYYDKGVGRAFALGVHMIGAVGEAEDNFEDDAEDDGFMEAPVQYGDTVEAQGMGALFTSLLGGIGRGKVVHVGKPNYKFENDQVREEHLAGKSDQVHLTEGVMFMDDQLGEIMWLAEGDFKVVGE